MKLNRLSVAAFAAVIALAPVGALANTTTTNLGLNKPGVGADSDLWGAYLNTNSDTLDALFGAGPVLLVTKGGTGVTTSTGSGANVLGTSPTIATPNLTGTPTIGSPSAWRAALSAAVTGANSDITSLSGLTTALSIGQGGTGQTTASAAINALVPTQTSNSGKFLTTNGSSVSWATVATTASGTWTPALSFAGGTGSSFSYTSQGGDYYCTGGWVTADAYIAATVTVGSASGNLRISLPNSYTIANTNRVSGDVSNLTFPNSSTTYGIASDTTSTLILQSVQSAAGSGLPAGAFTNGVTLTLAFTVTFKNASGTC